MYYAIRTKSDSQKQLLTFESKKSRDDYCRFEGGTAISAKEKNNLMPVNLSRSVRGVSCIYKIQEIATNRD